MKKIVVIYLKVYLKISLEKFNHHGNEMIPKSSFISENIPPGMNFKNHPLKNGIKPQIKIRSQLNTVKNSTKEPIIKNTLKI